MTALPKKYLNQNFCFGPKNSDPRRPPERIYPCRKQNIISGFVLIPLGFLSNAPPFLWRHGGFWVRVFACFLLAFVFQSPKGEDDHGFMFSERARKISLCFFRIIMILSAFSFFFKSYFHLEEHNRGFSNDCSFVCSNF